MAGIDRIFCGIRDRYRWTDFNLAGRRKPCRINLCSIWNGDCGTDHRICSGIICTALFYKTMGTEIFETASGQDKL